MPTWNEFTKDGFLFKDDSGGGLKSSPLVTNPLWVRRIYGKCSILGTSLSGQDF